VPRAVVQSTVTLDRAAWEVCGQLGKEKASLSEFGNSSAELELQSRVFAIYSSIVQCYYRSIVLLLILS